MAKKKKGSGRDRRETTDGIFVDPARVRFQHSKIRPVFSGCGRSVEETLESIRRGDMKASDLPPIMVIAGPDEADGQWYFSLNNRRLWVLKRCREEGLLENNQIWVRVRLPKSDTEGRRYSVKNCALEAKIMREPSASRKASTAQPSLQPPPLKSDDGLGHLKSGIVDEQDDGEDSSESSLGDSSPEGPRNRFDVLL